VGCFWVFHGVITGDGDGYCSGGRWDKEIVFNYLINYSLSLLLMNYLIQILIIIAVASQSLAQEKNKADSTVLKSTIKDTTNSSFKTSYERPDIKDLLPSKKYSGYIKLYHPELKRLVYDGETKNGEITNGRYYKYDDDDFLIMVITYRNGEYQRDCQGI
jgi:hypothetical protein